MLLQLHQFEDPDVRDVIVDRANIERAPIKLTREEAVQLARTVGDGINVFSLDPLYKVFTRCVSFLSSCLRCQEMMAIRLTSGFVDFQTRYPGSELPREMEQDWAVCGRPIG